MSSPDYQMQQEEECHQQHLLDVLVRVENWQHNREDVLILAAELGLTNAFQQEKKHEQIKSHG